MIATLNDYYQQIKRLLPRGALWTGLEKDAVFSAYLEGEVAEKERINARACGLIDEADPRTTLELLSEWESFAGLPDKCGGVLGTIPERQAALHRKLTWCGGQSAAFFVALAADYGQVISISEYEIHTVISGVDAPLSGDGWGYVWQVRSAATDVTSSTVCSGVDVPLGTWGNRYLECIINRYKPAHVRAIYSYGES